MNDAPTTRPPVTYPVTLADLIDIADAARDLDESRQFYVDRPGERRQIAARSERLHGIVERAAAHDAHLIYGPAEESDHEPQHP